MTDDELVSVLSHSPEIVSVYELDGTVVYMNPVAESTVGMTLEQLRGKRIFDQYPESVGSPSHTAFQLAATTGEMQTFQYYSPHFDRWFSSRVIRVGTRVHVYGREVTEEVRRQRRLDALSCISDQLTRTDLDMQATAHGLCQIMTDALDAECTIATLTPDQQWLELLCRTSRDAEALAITEPVKRWSAAVGTPGEALRTRTTVLDASPTLTATPIEDATLRAVVDRYQPGSVIVAPLLVDDRALGMLIATRRNTVRPLTQHDRVLVADVAPTIALYLSSAGRRSEADQLRKRLTAITDALPTLVSFIDRNERYQYVNAGYRRWFGVSADHWVGYTLREKLGEGYAVIEPHVKKVLAGEPVHYQSRVPYPTGTRDVDAHYVPVFAADGSVDGFAVLVSDITTEVTLADVERQSTRRLQTLLSVTGRLAGAATREEIAVELLDAGGDAFDSATAAMWQLAKDGTAFEMIRQRGLAPNAKAFARLPIDRSGPLQVAMRTRRPVYVSTTAEYAEQFPELEGPAREHGSTTKAFVTLPLIVAGEPDSYLTFTFEDERTLSVDERTYLEVLALHAGEALRRASAYEELHDLSEVQATMIQSSPGAIVLADSNGNIHSWNDAAERIFGWPASAVLGKPLPNINDDTFRANLRRVLESAEGVRIESRRQRANGEWFDLEVYAAPVRLSRGRDMALAMVFDISDRKRVERGRQLVNEASARFNRSLECERTLHDVVELPLGTLADWCCVDLLADDGSLSRVAMSRDGVAAEGLDQQFARAVIESRKPSLVRNLDGSAMRSSLSVPLLVGDRLVGALSLAARERNFDELDVSIVTELAAHAATAIDNARLFEVAQKARSEAEAANRSKDEFLAMLGHELRNPLAPLTTALDLMRMKGDDVFQRERAVLRRQVSHLSQLVDDLLDVSKITRGKVELRRERVTLADVVSKAIEQTSPLLDERRHHLAVDVPADLFVHADPTRLAQIAANLVSNAAKYTPPGGRITVTARREASTVVLAVRDNGVGIGADMLPRVFDLFVQAPQPSGRPVGGLGLGLAIVRSLVTLHGGTVAVRSEGPGKGSEFTVTLPAPDVAPAISDPAIALRQRAVEPRRILVVDDNEDAALMLADLLDLHGHEIRTAFDAPSALRIATEFRPEIAVLDIGLPVMDGYELAERLRSDPSLANLRLIALTGYGQESDRARSREAGFQAHLAKPVEIETLVRLVERN